MAKLKRQSSVTDYFPEQGLAVQNLSATAFAGMEPEAEKVIQQLERRIEDLPVDRLLANPFQPRKIFDQERLEELAASIQEYGLLQRIIVRPSPERLGMYEIIAGERRWRASILAGLPTCPAEILNNCSDDKMRQVAIIENIQRVDLSPLELAETYYELTRIDERGHQLYSIRALANALGCNKSHVEDHLRLLKVPPEVRQLIIDDPKMPLRIIAEIGSVDNAVDRADLIEEVRRRNENGWNTADVIKIVRTLKKPATPPPPPIRAESDQVAHQRPTSFETGRVETSQLPDAGKTRHMGIVPSENFVSMSQTQTHPEKTEPEVAVEATSPTLQIAKFKLAWEKHDQVIQRVIDKLTQEQPTYNAEQQETAQAYLQRWLHQLQEILYPGSNSQE